MGGVDGRVVEYMCAFVPDCVRVCVVCVCALCACVRCVRVRVDVLFIKVKLCLITLRFPSGCLLRWRKLILIFCGQVNTA